MTQKTFAGALWLLALPLLSGCAGSSCDGPASSRGFFCGVAAMTTGADERNAARLENTAATQESAAGTAGLRASRAQTEANRTSAEVQAAQRRLEALRQNLRTQRAALERLRAEQGQSGPRAAEVARLQAQLDSLEREQRAAAQRAGGASPAAMQRLEKGADDFNAAMRSFGSS